MVLQWVANPGLTAISRCCKLSKRQVPFSSNSVCCSIQVDFGYFGPPEEHYKWTKEKREGTYVTPDDPSSEVGGEMAAALAAASVALRQTDPVYADKLVVGAKTVRIPTC